MSEKHLLRRSADPGIALVGALVGDPARAAMLCALLGGRERTAGELAHAAGVAPNAATGHLHKLRAGGLVEMRADGRRRFFRLAGARVARAIEALAAIAPPAKVVALSQSRIAADLQCARRCYDHLAGRLGVGVTERLVGMGSIAPLPDDSYSLGSNGEAFFADLGVDLNEVRASRRRFARQCIDWSERRPHLAGALGAALCNVFLRNDWIARKAESRALIVTPAGRHWLHSQLGISL